MPSQLSAHMAAADRDGSSTELSSALEVRGKCNRSFCMRQLVHTTKGPAVPLRAFETMTTNRRLYRPNPPLAASKN